MLEVDIYDLRSTHPKELGMHRIALLGLLLGGNAFAGTLADFSFTVLPASPQANQPVQIRVNVEAGSCYPLHNYLGVSHPGPGIVQFEVIISDTCTPDLPAQERVYDVGSFVAGQYVFRYALCGQIMSGDYVCTTVTEEGVTVSPGGISIDAHAVPALSWMGLSAAVGLILLSGGMFGRMK